jgi:hypothetical protein
MATLINSTVAPVVLTNKDMVVAPTQVVRDGELPLWVGKSHLSDSKGNKLTASISLDRAYLWLRVSGLPCDKNRVWLRAHNFNETDKRGGGWFLQVTHDSVLMAFSNLGVVGVDVDTVVKLSAQMVIEWTQRQASKAEAARQADLKRLSGRDGSKATHVDHKATNMVWQNVEPPVKVVNNGIHFREADKRWVNATGQYIGKDELVKMGVTPTVSNGNGKPPITPTLSQPDGEGNSVAYTTGYEDALHDCEHEDALKNFTPRNRYDLAKLAGKTVDELLGTVDEEYMQGYLDGMALARPLPVVRGFLARFKK